MPPLNNLRKLKTNNKKRLCLFLLVKKVIQRELASGYMGSGIVQSCQGDNAKI